MNQIRLGLPKGSLNTVGRGNTGQVLADAGYEVRGYEPGKESDRNLTIVNDPEIIAFLTRPQSAPVELSRSMLDIAVVGEDWVREESVAGAKVKKVGDLEYGKTRLVFAVPQSTGFESLGDFLRAQRERKTPILCFTEYPNLTRQRIMAEPEYQERFGTRKPLIQVRGLVNGDNELVQIINSDGITEGYIRKGADIIVDNTQTGSALREYGLRELETIMTSTAGLYKGPSCTGWKKEKAGEIFEMLRGAIEGRRYFDVKFNIPTSKVDDVRAYLTAEGLCSDEPTIVQGKIYAAVNVLMPRGKFPRALKGLSNFGASAIVRNPVEQFMK